MTWARLGLLLVVLAGALPAQLVDTEKSRFASDAWGRAGTCAPFEVVLVAPAGSTVALEIHWGSVVLASEAAVSPPSGRKLWPRPPVGSVQALASSAANRLRWAWTLAT